MQLLVAAYLFRARELRGNSSWQEDLARLDPL